MAVAGLHRYKIITPLIQSSREELDSKVSDSDLWKCQKWGHVVRCFAAPLSYTIIWMYCCIQSLLHGHTWLQVSWCTLKKGERPAICSVLLLPKRHRILTARQSLAADSLHLGSTRECK